MSAMVLPLLDQGALGGLLCGLAFGVVLERAGFGSGCKLTAQFRLVDWSMFKVMFTAIVAAAVGLYALGALGWLDQSKLYVPIPYVGGIAIGAALIGAGFSVGGYCPGTSVVGLVSGRLDALMFFVGLLLGTVVFAGAYDWVGDLTEWGEFTGGDRLPEALGVPEPVILIVLVLAAIGVFYLGTWFERRASKLGSH